MRSTLFVVALLPAVAGFGQDNNPFDSKGKDYASSLALIQADFQAGKVKEINEQTLAYYSRNVPSRNAVTLELASKVVETLKSPQFDFETFMSSAAVPAFTKEIYLHLYRESFRLHGDAFADFLRSEAESVTNAEIERDEKESLLTLIAMIYHAREARQGCTITITTPDGVMVDDSGTGCIIVGIGAGFFLGNAICGIPCGIGGAIVGGIIGALT